MNAITRKDAYPLARIDDLLESLGGAVWFCTLDLASGYWQVPIAPLDKEKTAFATKRGMFQFKYMPFGLSNAPATFVRLMDEVLKGLIGKHCLVYLDDVIIFGQTFDQTLSNLKLIFDRIRQHKLTLKAKKCVLFRKEVEFLGHMVTAQGVQTSPAKVEAVKTWPIPSNGAEIRSFLGFASYYRKFIPYFSSISAPLTNLTRKKVKFIWDASCQNSFETLQQKLIEAPVLAYPTPDDEFVLDTDASGAGIGAVLSQIQNGEEKVIAYASKSLSKAQRNYCTTYRELLAVVTFVKGFKHYLWGRKFLIRTDHASLTWLLNFKEPEGMISRWLATLFI